MVEACLSGVVKCKKFFEGAQSACLRDRIVGWSPAKNIPRDGVGDVGLLQVPNIPGQLSVPSFLLVVRGEPPSVRNRFRLVLGLLTTIV